MSSLEYVMSGLSYTRMPEAIRTTAENNDLMVEIFSDIFQEAIGGTSLDISLLYNGYVEAKFGELVKPYKDIIHKVHVDSGGLQIITRGLESSFEKRSEVYKVQAEEDVAMSFDEIPIKIHGETSSRGQTSNRMFSNNWREFAQMSARNLLEQVKAFDELESECGVFMIAHGNGIQTYKDWAEICMNEIPQSLQHHVKGVSLGPGGYGFGQLEEIGKALILEDLSNSFDNCHILGIGSLDRVSPYNSLFKLGRYDNYENVSFDSTSHSRIHIFGEYIGKRGRPYRVRAHNFAKVKEEMLKTFPKTIAKYDMDFDYDFLFATASEIKKLELSTEELCKYFGLVLILVLSSVIKFCNEVEDAEILKFIDGIDSSNFDELQQDLKQIFKSKPVTAESNTTTVLDGLI